MKIIIGLGNPGRKYHLTRHNVGHLVADRLPDSLRHFKTDCYMNQSGIFVRRLLDFYKISPSDLCLIHDDLDLPVGEYRLQYDRGPAGHHGVESVVEHLSTQAFWRLRLGIGRPPENIPGDQYVLCPFSKTEKQIIDTAIDKIIPELINWGL